MASEDSNLYHQLFQHTSVGYAYMQVISDHTGKPVDFTFLDFNPAFEKMSGLYRSEALNQKLSHVYPDQWEKKTEWIETYLEVSEHGEEIEMEGFPPILGTARVRMCSTEKGRFFISVLDTAYPADKTPSIQGVHQDEIQSISIKSISNQIRLLSGAEYAIFNLYEEDGKSYLTVDVAGKRNMLIKASEMFGFPILGRRWPHNPVMAEKIQPQTITRFTSLHEQVGSLIPYPVVMGLEKLFNIGETALITIKKANVMLGHVTVIMKYGKQLQNEHLLEAYAKQVGLLLTRSMAEKALKKAEVHLKNVIANVPGVVFRSQINENGSMEFVSEGIESLTGFSSNDPVFATKDTFSSLIHPDDWKMVRKRIDEAIDTYRSYEVEYRIRTKEGKEKWVQERGQPVQESRDQLWLDGVIMDITERKKAEQQIDEQSQLQHILLRISNAFINESLEHIDLQIHSALRDLATYVEADRAYIFEYSLDQETYTNTYEWCSPGISSHIDHLQKVPLNIEPDWVHARHRQGDPVCIPDVGSLQPSPWKDLLRNQQIQSFLTVPMMREGECIGFVGFDFVCKAYDDSEKEQYLLGLFAQMLVNLSIRKDAQTQLKESEERYRNLFFAGIEGLVIHQNGIIREINPSLLKMIGYTREEVLGKEVTMIIHPDDMAAAVENKGQDYDAPVELRVRKKNGETVFVETEAKDIDFEGEKMRIGAVRDITRRKKAEDTLLKQARFNEMVSRISRTFISAHPDTLDQMISDMLKECGRFFEVDRAYVFQISKDRETISNTYEWCTAGVRPQKEFLQEMSLSTFEWLLSQVQANGHVHIDSFDALPEIAQDEREAFNRSFLKDPKERQKIQTMLVVPLLGFQGEMMGLFGLDSVLQHRDWDSEMIPLIQVLADILSDAFQKARLEQEWLESKEQAQSANQAKTRFVSSLSHEIRTPLNGLIGSVEMLQETVENPTQKKLMDYILSSAHSLTGLIGNVLDMSMVEAGIFKLREEPVSIEALCRHTVNIIEPMARQKGLNVKVHISQEIPARVQADPKRLGQILVNLLSNAVKYTDKGEVNLSVSLSHRSQAQDLQDQDRIAIRFSIVDTGHGISQDHLHRLGEEYFQVRKNHSKVQGTGLGLAITSEILKKMHSSLEVNSKEGQGSEFAFTLALIAITEGV